MRRNCTHLDNDSLSGGLEEEDEAKSLSKWPESMENHLECLKLAKETELCWGEGETIDGWSESICL